MEKEKLIKITVRRIKRKISKFKKDQKLGKLNEIDVINKAISIKCEIFQLYILAKTTKQPKFINGGIMAGFKYAGNEPILNYKNQNT